MAAYQAALLGQSAPVAIDLCLPRQVRLRRSLPLTWRAPNTSASVTRASRAMSVASNAAQRARSSHVSGLSRERIVTGILHPYADRPGAALDVLKKLRILIRHADKLSNSRSFGLSALNNAQRFIFF